MVKSWKHKLVPTLLAGTMALSFGGAVSADNGNGNGNGKENAPGQVKKGDQQNQTKKIFTDIDNYWAKDAIERMANYQILKGYPDSTFRPHKPVTQLQAVTMIMNLLEQTSADLETNGDDYTGNVPDWAKETVELAVYNDIVSWEDIEQYNKPATRMFVVNLLVNALVSADIDDLDDFIEDNLIFGDIDDLSSEDRSKLALAVAYTLVTGYQDKTFKPNKPVTRGEMAAFTNRLFDKIDFDFDDDLDRITGTIKNFDKDDDELQIDSKIYEISHDIEVKIDGKDADFEDLENGMRVTAYFEDDEIVKIFAYDGNDGYWISGAISDIDIDDDEIKIGSNTYEVSDDVKVEIDDRVRDFDDLEKNMEIRAYLENGEIIEIRAESDDNENEVEFKIERVSDNDDEIWKITVEDDAEKDETYEIEVEVEDNNDDFKETIVFSVDENDTAEDIADTIAKKLKYNSNITSAFKISVDDEEVTLKAEDEDDLDVEIEINIK